MASAHSPHLLPLLLLLALCLCCDSASEDSQQTQGWPRAKRQYYDESYYGSYYGWQAGRIVGWLIGFLVLLLCICIPCICCAGIWFLGWFGLRQTMASRQARRRDEGLGRVIAARNQQEVSAARRYVDAAPSPVAAEQRYVYSTDRYFERRHQRSPPPSNEGGGAYAANGVGTREARRL